jgi:NAD(P)-dependent dehydrogenase (short-subunit alcohol dehydrogenase family)
MYPYDRSMASTNDSIILITGATDGLGKRVARDLAARGAAVLLHGRNADKGGAVLSELRRETGSEKLTYYNADFASLEEVRDLADQLLEEHDRLDVLINNAGIGFGAPGSGREESREGYELRFQVNYLASFLLTLRLLPLLRRARPSRIVNVASGAQQPIDFDDVMLERGYSGHQAYGQSKLAQIMFTMELAARLNTSDVTVNALHPATYMDTNMVREADINPTNTVQVGADAVVRLAAAPELDDTSGRYFDGTRPSRAHGDAYDGPTRLRLWQLSEVLSVSSIHDAER